MRCQWSPDVKVMDFPLLFNLKTCAAYNSVEKTIFVSAPKFMVDEDKIGYVRCDGCYMLEDIVYFTLKNLYHEILHSVLDNIGVCEECNRLMDMSFKNYLFIEDWMNNE